jgi:hypothetical protein
MPSFHGRIFSWMVYTSNFVWVFLIWILVTIQLWLHNQNSDPLVVLRWVWDSGGYAVLKRHTTCSSWHHNMGRASTPSHVTVWVKVICMCFYLPSIDPRRPHQTPVRIWETRGRGPCQRLHIRHCRSVFYLNTSYNKYAFPLQRHPLNNWFGTTQQLDTKKATISGEP